MSDAYKMVQHGHRSRGDFALYAMLAGCVLIFAAIIIPVFLQARHFHLFHTFIGDVCKSSIESKGEVICSYDGKSEQFDDGKLDQLLVNLTNGGGGKIERKLPEREPFRIIFTDGAELKMWCAEQVDPDFDEIIPCLIVSFDRADGRTFSYLTNDLSADMIRYILPKLGREWIEQEDLYLGH